MHPGDSSIKREQHRAKLLHGIFSRVHGLPLTNEGKLLQARKLGAWRDLRSLKTFGRLYSVWKKSPSQETLLRRWSNGQTTDISTLPFSVTEFAAMKKLSVHAACKLFELPISYSTILRRNSKARFAGKIAKIERERKRLANAAKTLLQAIEGIEP